VDSAFDWRDFGKVTPVRNQAQCGSCWTFAVTAATESFALVEDKAEEGVDLAEQFLLECTSGSDCGGGYLERAMDVVVEKQGMPNENAYPYKERLYYGSSDICNAQIDL
jgi:C1A family cysteine protease